MLTHNYIVYSSSSTDSSCCHVNKFEQISINSVTLSNALGYRAS